MAFREGKAKIANSFQTDQRSAAWRKIHPMEEIGSAASVPLLRNGRSVGVFLFMLNEANALTDEVVGLLERMVANVSFALDVFERDQQRARAERANRRLTDMFAALSATNTAILRASDRKEMFQLVCDAVAGAGQSLGAAAIFLKKRGDHLLQLAAAAGQAIDAIQEAGDFGRSGTSTRARPCRSRIPRADAQDRLRSRDRRAHEALCRRQPSPIWSGRSAAGAAGRVDRHHLFLLCPHVGER